jgi:hypothetical protein
MMPDDHDDEIVERLTALRQKISDTVWTLATDAAQQFAPDALDALVKAKQRRRNRIRTPTRFPG